LDANRARLLILVLVLSSIPAWPPPALGRAPSWGPPPTEEELADVFQEIAEDYLQRSAISEKTRDGMRERYYSDEEAARFARAVYLGLDHRGVPREDAAPYVALITSAVFQQSSGQRTALSHNGGPDEPIGEDVGWYQLRMKWVFCPGGIWDEVYPDRPKPTTREAQTAALLDPTTAGPLWVEHILRQQATCEDYLRTATAAKLTTSEGGPLRYCEAPSCTETRRCWVVREAFGIPTYNGGASHVATWGSIYRKALRRVRERAGGSS